MTVTITYCVPCNYEKRAKDAADAITQHLGLTVELVPGGGGVFDIAVNGSSVSKRTNDHFPSTDEIVAAVRGQATQP
jgi:selenoprotein W-related protein